MKRAIRVAAIDRMQDVAVEQVRYTGEAALGTTPVAAVTDMRMVLPGGEKRMA